jgi:hypothetical protein
MTNGEKFINLKYGNPSRDHLVSFRRELATELREINDRNDEIFTTYKGVHGRFQQSQLDVLDIRKMKVYGMIDQVDAMIAKRGR